MLDFSRLGTLPDLLTYHAETQPERIATEFEGRETSYRALQARTDRLAKTLLTLDPEPHSRIAYLGKNSDHYFELLFATAKAGKVLVPLNWRLTQDEWSYILDDAQVGYLFTDNEFAAAGAALAHRLLLTAVSPLQDSWDYLIKDTVANVPLRTVAASDVVLQIYTSGTTGKPKGTLLSHTNVLALREPGLRANLEWFPRACDTSLVAMPVAHIAGTAYGLFGLHSGGRLVICREFNPQQVWHQLAHAGVTHMLLAPTALRMLLEASTPDACAPHLRYVTYGGSPITPAVLQQALARLKCGLTQMYGMTEAAGGIVALTPRDHDAGQLELLGCAGRAMLGVELGIIDAEGTLVRNTEVGEIVIRSEAVMAGYWRQPEATADAFTSEGWLRTGDLGWLDANGYLTVVDRAKDTIVTGGENVYPLEVEHRLLEHASVHDVAVIGIPSERWGEEVKAIVVPVDLDRFDSASLLAYARQHLAAYKVPKSVELAAELPRNAGGKVLRRALREPYWVNHVKRVG
ncbi:long-chain-fatty-acid--CoA ligase [Pseudomonas putida]|uniref:long-chain-fatty-acid--CoA ligase n=1 Tax=Pseudomonas putida TaxID=303 RepID=UPI0023639566|nr:long-chain-fatty-acid--CoA ligase [Pseudomonas putida]MDD2068674.1 long-chain-fatty-acid--CoA ligase [Pseudomonas putida]HDS1738607.1 long-chain-fatty-acid--CoA ligase [Pseudomonas putida]